MSRKAPAYTCPLCGVKITGTRRIAQHEAAFKLPHGHPRRCYNAPVITAPVIEFGTNEEDRMPCATVVEAELLVQDLEPFEGRFTRPQERKQFLFTLSPIDQCRGSTVSPRNLTNVQDAWEQFKDAAVARYSEEFWMFFLSIHKQPRNTIDAALLGAKRIFGKGLENSKTWSNFPTCKKTLERHINALPAFLPLITHTKVIDLTPLGYEKKLEFRYLDPLWAWVRAAERLPPESLHWVPVMQTLRSTGERVYGGGVR